MDRQRLAAPEWTAVLDEAAARRCARSYGVKVKGALAVIIPAKQRGLIPSAADALRLIRSAGLRLNDAIIAEVLPRAVGETWSETGGG